MKRVIALSIMAMMAGSAQAVESKTTTYVCEFPSERSQNLLPIRTGSPMNLDFKLDATTKKAYMHGNVSTNEVQVIQNWYGISFVEVTRSGNVTVTSITKEGAAVHSRNFLHPGGMLPSQWYGTCAMH